MPYDVILKHLGVAPEPPSLSFLGTLQRRWCLTQPFHNLDLLAAAGAGAAPLGPDEALARCAEGLGGPCHVHASAFLAVARHLGFEATLAGATVTFRDDHLLVRVDAAGCWLVDVGNGQPYLVPFSTIAADQQHHLGWTVRTTPGEGGVLVERASPDQPVFRRVYEAWPTPRTWSDFEPSIRKHHATRGFGPFLTGLRVVRIGENEMVTVRDDMVTRYRRGGVERTSLAPDALRRFISDYLGLGALPVDRAIESWLSARAA